MTATDATTTFSAAEAAVYDRQMRLWGVEAQKRLQSSHVLVSGLSALGTELVKNLVLAGMNVTLQDATSATAACVNAQFFLHEDDIRKNRATASVARVRGLNPLVRVECETKPLDQLADDFFTQFTVVCVVGASKETELRLDALCRAHGIAFFAAHTFGFEGSMFADLGTHTYRRSPVGENAQPTEPITVQFPALADAHKVQWSQLKSARKRGPQLPRVFVKNQLLLEFRSVNGVQDIVAEQTDAFVQFAQAQLKAHGLEQELFSVEELSSLVAVSSVDLVPICAILGGIIGQEIIKAISLKDEPICNYFFLDGSEGAVRRIGA
ncbi:TPA: hypothetical protein N0F65_011915 [Lagenidium giganteum]|uniref:Ubiquitin-like 1-activating enzyme E1A n=1 Tax=Lagenidium giganteum TaxID=4803 RepID=A0AAV2YSM0_9STRA|nr:TPA: hypothetical protein N0F65_011915 [Lagenidium giganteum]